MIAITVMMLTVMIKKREWDLLSIELRANEELSVVREGKGLLLHFALCFHAPLFIISQLTHGLHTTLQAIEIWRVDLLYM